MAVKVGSLAKRRAKGAMRDPQKPLLLPIMYIRRIEINNIRSIEHFEMTFPEGKEAGWHVLIGDNGSGKSTIVRAVAACLVGNNEIDALRLTWYDWMRKSSPASGMNVSLIDPLRILSISFESTFKPESNSIIRFSPTTHYSAELPENVFSAAYGPFRRFTGGNKDWDKVGKAYPRAAAHMSAFGEDIALTEALDYIRELYISELDKTIDPGKVDRIALSGIIKFINHSKMLPNGARILGVNSESISIIVADNTIIPITQLSDGFRSILSLVLDMLHRLILVFGSDKVFKEILEGDKKIYLPGIVIIDEVDAHLHPDWQDAIGEWFTTYFPNIQFIVTTHSPLVCRAAEKGSIWRLATPGSGEQSSEITGTARDRLIYGSISDAYGTETFGNKAPISEAGNELLNELAELNIKSIMGQITPEEETRMVDIQRILPTEQHPERTHE